MPPRGHLSTREKHQERRGREGPGSKEEEEEEGGDPHRRRGKRDTPTEGRQSLIPGSSRNLDASLSSKSQPRPGPSPLPVGQSQACWFQPGTTPFLVLGDSPPGRGTKGQGTVSCVWSPRGGGAWWQTPDPQRAPPSPSHLHTSLNQVPEHSTAGPPLAKGQASRFGWGGDRGSGMVGITSSCLGPRLWRECSGSCSG